VPSQRAQSQQVLPTAFTAHARLAADEIAPRRYGGVDPWRGHSRRMSSYLPPQRHPMTEQPYIHPAFPQPPDPKVTIWRYMGAPSNRTLVGTRTFSLRATCACWSIRKRRCSSWRTPDNGSYQLERSPDAFSLCTKFYGECAAHSACSGATQRSTLMKGVSIGEDAGRTTHNAYLSRPFQVRPWNPRLRRRI
jgi:hypothetical protein